LWREQKQLEESNYMRIVKNPKYAGIRKIVHNCELKFSQKPIGPKTERVRESSAWEGPAG